MNYWDYGLIVVIYISKELKYIEVTCFISLVNVHIKGLLSHFGTILTLEYTYMVPLDYKVIFTHVYLKRGVM